MTTSNQTKQSLVTLLAILPVAWLVLVYLFVIRVRFHLGHWPTPSDGMAKYMGFPIHHTLSVYSFIAAPLATLAVIAITILLRRRNPAFGVSLPLAVLSVSVVLSTVLFATDPGRFIV